MKSSAGHLYLSLKPFDGCGNNLNSGTRIFKYFLIEMNRIDFALAFKETRIIQY